jgi:predicted kinase
MQRVIVLRGIMTSGKSTIAKEYRSFANKTIWLRVDNFKDFFDSYEAEIRPYVHGAANASLEYFLKEGFSIVMEGVFQNPDFVQQAVDIANRHSVPCRVFQLKISLPTAQQRDKTREGVPEGLRPAIPDEEIAGVYRTIEEHPFKGALELDTEHMTIEECIAFINKQFN